MWRHCTDSCTVSTTHYALSSSPFNQLYHYEVIAVPPVVENKAVGGCCLELHEEMHGVVGLQCGQCDKTGARAEGDGVSHDALIANNSVELAVVNVAVLAQVDVGHAVQRQALKVADKIGGHSRHEALLRHDTRLHIVELQLGVVARHLTWWRGGKLQRWGLRKVGFQVELFNTKPNTNPNIYINIWTNSDRLPVIDVTDTITNTITNVNTSVVVYCYDHNRDMIIFTYTGTDVL